MAGFFRQPGCRQHYLLPVDMMDWLPDGDIVHLVVDAVELMDLSQFEAEHRVGGAGQAPFAPKVLLALLIYAYSQGIRSSRKIERLCERNAGDRFIVGAEVPDHTVIARFRRRHSTRMAAVFGHVLAKHQQDKLDARAAEEQAAGQRKRGRKPKAPDASVDAGAVANPTDPDSRIMKTRRGWVQGDNAQAAVAQDQIILAADVTDAPNDVQQLDGMLAQAEANAAATLGPARSLGAVVADAGYWSESNVKAERPGCELFIATQKDHK